MKIRFGLGFALTTLALAQVPEPSEDADRLSYGAQVLVAAPRQDLRALGGKTGLGLGLFAETRLGASTVLQTRLDYLRFAETRDLAPGKPYPFLRGTPLSMAANAVSLGADLRYNLPYAGLRRVFLLAGAMVGRYEFRYVATSTAVDQNGIPVTGRFSLQDRTTLKLGVAAGLGYDFDGRWALSLRATTLPVDNASLATLETALSVRF